MDKDDLTPAKIGAYPQFFVTTATDFDTVRTTGIYHIKVGGCTGLPTSNWGTVIVDWEVGTKYQMFIPDGEVAAVYKRKGDAASWGSWINLSSKDGNGRNIADTYAVKSEYRLKKYYEINLSSYSNANFYLVTFDHTDFEIDCEIHSPSLPGNDSYNQNILHFLLAARGWNDTPKKLIILNHTVYSSSEITIASIVSGQHEGMNGVYLRGGMKYRIYSNTNITLRTSQFTNGSEIFASGGPTSYKTGFTNVSLDIDFTASNNTGNFACFKGDLRADHFIGNADSATKAIEDGLDRNIADTYATYSYINKMITGGGSY